MSDISWTGRAASPKKRETSDFPASFTFSPRTEARRSALVGTEKEENSSG